MDPYFKFLKDAEFVSSLSVNEEQKLKRLFGALHSAESKYRIKYATTSCVGKLSDTCCGDSEDIIKSHTIPKNAFSELGDDLIAFQSSTISILNDLYSPDITKTSKGDASTFKGFCQGCPSCELSFSKNGIDIFPLTTKKFRFFICRDLSRRLLLRTNFCDFYDKNIDIYNNLDKFHELCFNEANYFKMKRHAIGLENQKEIDLIKNFYHTSIIYDSLEYDLDNPGFVLGAYFKYINHMPLYFLFWVKDNKQKLTIYYKDTHLKFLYTLFIIFKGESFLYFILLNAMMDHYPNIYIDTKKSLISFDNLLESLKENGIFTGVNENMIFQYFISNTCYFKPVVPYPYTDAWEKLFIASKRNYLNSNDFKHPLMFSIEDISFN